MAEGYGSALPLAVRCGGGVPTPLGDRVLVPVGGGNPARTFLSSLIPVPKDLGTLDSCDKHRNEGSGRGGAAFSISVIGGVPAACAERAVPPSVLPDISPTRGEIVSPRASPQTTDVVRWSRPLSISPRVGEMPGRAEGGVTPAAAKESTLRASRRILSLGSASA